MIRIDDLQCIYYGDYMGARTHVFIGNPDGQLAYCQARCIGVGNPYTEATESRHHQVSGH
jgi:hypothetical protein